MISADTFSLPTTVADTTEEATSNWLKDLLVSGYSSEELNMENTMLVSPPLIVSLEKAPGGSIIATVSLARVMASSVSAIKSLMVISRPVMTIKKTPMDLVNFHLKKHRFYLTNIIKIGKKEKNVPDNVTRALLEIHKSYN